MRYKEFSDPKNINVMTRTISVFEEEITLRVVQLPWKPNPYKKRYGNYIKYASTPSKNKLSVFIYWDAKKEREMLNFVCNNLLSKADHYKELKSFFHGSYNKYKKLSDQIYCLGSEYYRRQPKRRLLAWFNKFCDCLEYVLFSYYIPYDLISVCSTLVLNELQDIAKDNKGIDVDKTFKILSTVGIESLVKREKVCFYKRLNLINALYKKSKNWENSKIQKIIFDHWYNFGALMYTHGENNSYTLDDYNKKFYKFIGIDVRRELNRIAKDEAKAKKVVANIIATLHKYPVLKKHILWLREMMRYRNCESELSYIYFNRSHCLLKEISKKLGLDEYGIWYLSRQETVNGLEGKIDVSNIVQKRQKYGFTIKQVGRDIKVLTGVNKNDLHEERVNKRVSELNGTPAFGGKVRGVARIIIDAYSDSKLFQRDEILVTPMTTPEFVTLMKKAKAIITDEGGLLCHAAIVSRELKIPCIIGTKIATKVLRDGDSVEVDANKGIVTIIQQ